LLLKNANNHQSWKNGTGRLDQGRAVTNLPFVKCTITVNCRKASTVNLCIATERLVLGEVFGIF
jgi:hypothetical protein